MLCRSLTSCMLQRFITAQMVSGQTLTRRACIQLQASQHGICGRQNGTGTGFTLSTSVYLCQLLHQCSISICHQRLIEHNRLSHPTAKSRVVSVPMKRKLLDCVHASSRTACNIHGRVLPLKLILTCNAYNQPTS